MIRAMHSDKFHIAIRVEGVGWNYANFLNFTSSLEKEYRRVPMHYRIGQELNEDGFHLIPNLVRIEIRRVSFSTESGKNRRKTSSHLLQIVSKIY